MKIYEDHVSFTFTTTVNAIQCVRALNGAAWKGYAVGAEFDLASDIERVDEADDDTKLQAFLASMD